MLLLHEVAGLEFNGVGFNTPGSCVSRTKYDENINILVLTIQQQDVEDDLNEWLRLARTSSAN